MLSDYQHPYVTVDGVVLRFQNARLEVLLVTRDDGKIALPGGFLDIDKTLDEALEQKVFQKTGIKGFYMEQLKTYDALDRDPRGRILSVAYLAFLNKQTDDSELPDDVRWCPIIGNGSAWELAFDHEQILADGLQRLKNKFFYSDLPGYLLQAEFTALEGKELWGCLSGHSTFNVHRFFNPRTIETGKTAETKGRPAALLRWKWGWNDDGGIQKSITPRLKPGACKSPD